ncbi:hypothetical protein ACJ41O_000500 [Fusarium nematophilum]
MVVTRSTTTAAPKPATAPKPAIFEPGSSRPAKTVTFKSGTKFRKKRSKRPISCPRPPKRIKREPSVTPPASPDLPVPSYQDEYNTKEDDPCGIRLFGQDSFIKEDDALREQFMLEFYQAYPHNRGATLCLSHFYQLAEHWYRRHVPTAEAQLDEVFADAAEDIDFGKPGYVPDFSQVMLPVDERTWMVKSLQDFRDDLCDGILEAKVRLLQDTCRAFWLHSDYPAKCEIVEDQPLSCSLCPEPDDVYIPLEHMSTVPPKLRIMAACRENQDRHVLECGHQFPVLILGGDRPDRIECEECPRTQPVKDGGRMPHRFALKVADAQIPVQVRPARMPINSRAGHVDVGGLHFLVDDCTDRTMVKFR